MLERQVVDSGGDDTAPAETTTAKVAKAMARTSLPDHDHRGRGARGSKRTRGTSEVRAAAGTAAPGAASTKTSANANTSTNTDDYSSVACSRSFVGFRDRSVSHRNWRCAKRNSSRFSSGTSPPGATGIRAENERNARTTLQWASGSPGGEATRLVCNLPRDDGDAEGRAARRVAAQLQTASALYGSPDPHLRPLLPAAQLQWPWLGEL